MSPDTHTRVRQLPEQIGASSAIGEPIAFRALRQFAYWAQCFGSAISRRRSWLPIVLTSHP